MNTYRNHNIFALQGDSETSDMDVCETLGLDPALAGTPAINEAAIAKMHKQNYNKFTMSGISPDDALSRADSLANKARAKVRSLTKS